MDADPHLLIRDASVRTVEPESGGAWLGQAGSTELKAERRDIVRVEERSYTYGV
jgi:hypothetical protein